MYVVFIAAQETIKVSGYLTMWNLINFDRVKSIVQDTLSLCVFNTTPQPLDWQFSLLSIYKYKYQVTFEKKEIWKIHHLEIRTTASKFL